ncbi:MAG: response regulator [Candidatus Omnitrophota bacterium]
MKQEHQESLWKLCYDSFEPAEEGLREALCTLGNGYFATRGAVTESIATRIHYPGMYMAGVYDKLGTHLSGRTIYNEDLVNCPNWLLLSFRFEDDDWITPTMGRHLTYHQELDMHKGVFARHMRLRDHRDRRINVETKRIVHMGDPHYGALKYTIIPENYEGWLVIRVALDGSVQNTGVTRYRQLNSKHLNIVSLGAVGSNGLSLLVETRQSKIKIAQVAKTRIFVDGQEKKICGRIFERGKKEICQEFKIYLKKKQRCEIEKIVCIYSSREEGVQDPLRASLCLSQKAVRFDELFRAHQAVWDTLWRNFDIYIEGDDFAQKVLRLHIFHLLQTSSMHAAKVDAGLPARGLHGEAYRGHIFWDGIFAMPFFDLHAPSISKALLLYRYRRLPAAREYARENGYKGAMFPWQSGSTGSEETQIIHLNPISGKWGPDFSCIQRHVSFAIAYNVWHYWMRSGDVDFFIRNGAEILLSIAQFGASLLKFDPRDGRYHTEGLMGPDEFHERLPGAQKPGFRDNAYTNLLISWLLHSAQEVVAALPSVHKGRIFKKLGLNQNELSQWEAMSRNINVIFNKAGIIEQFDGYFRLKELDWKAYRAKYGNIQRLDRILKAEGKSPDDYKVSKQADVLMIFYLFSFPEAQDLFHRLGYKFDKEVLKKNYDYYVNRTSHGSTLSKVVHCYVAHLLGRMEESWSWFREVLRSDIYDTQGGTTVEGIHAGVMGGSFDVVMRGFAGVHLFQDRIHIDPCLPKSWSGIKLKFCYKGSWFSLAVVKNEAALCVYGVKGKRFLVPVYVGSKLLYLHHGQTYKIPLKKGGSVVQGRMVRKMTQERILIVDADVVWSQTLKNRLQDIGFVVECAHEGNEALDILKTKWFDLIVMSITLQGQMSGYHLLKEIKKTKTLSRTPVVMLSSKPAMQKTFEALKVKEYIVKPCDMDVFLEKIKLQMGK